MDERTTTAEAFPVARSAARSSGVARALVRIDRYAAWFSAVLLFLYFVSGFGMTKPDLVSGMTGGIVSPRLAYDMHSLLGIPLVVLFTIHTFTGLRRALVRTTRRRRHAAWIAGGLGLIVLGYLLTMNLFQPGL